ncbi:hypothetical protein Q8F55_004398 [Vanrija albida]|uniref:Rab proteins geranylgeranyltransferase n=1 Tax=Vanrija albida TaxID=181172 RepID=A0ABR3Q7S1_9TREE
MELESDKYDVIVLGTGLAESIAAAALAKAGKSVLHLDGNEYYGGDEASLTLDELAAWTHARAGASGTSSQAGSSEYLRAQRIRFTNATTTPLTPALQADRRRYAISLQPALMPSRGALVSTLISSDVSKYVSFRLLDGVSIWEDDAARRVPGGKEDVFKDKTVSLLDKRRLMKALMFIGSEFEDDEQLKGHESDGILDFLTATFALPPRLAAAVTYAIAHASSPTDPALASLVRARRYLRSMGRYGSSAFLVGQYGGAGEVAQGYCRACAVFGGTYVLGPPAMPDAIGVAEGGGVTLKIPGHPRPLAAGHLVSSDDFLPPTLAPAASGAVRTTARGVAVVTAQPAVLKRAPQPDADEDEAVAEDDDTAVVVFPPSGDAPLARALIMGEGTGSCPAGQWIVYLWTEAGAGDDAAATLRPFLERLAPNGAVFESYYLEHSVEPSSTTTSPSPPGVVRLETYTGGQTLTEALDFAAEAGRAAFDVVLGPGEHEGQGFFEKAGGDEDEAGDDDE